MPENTQLSMMNLKYIICLGMFGANDGMFVASLFHETWWKNARFGVICFPLPCTHCSASGRSKRCLQCIYYIFWCISCDICAVGIGMNRVLQQLALHTIRS